MKGTISKTDTGYKGVVELYEGCNLSVFAQAIEGVKEKGVEQTKDLLLGPIQWTLEADTAEITLECPQCHEQSQIVVDSLLAVCRHCRFRWCWKS